MTKITLEKFEKLLKGKFKYNNNSSVKKLENIYNKIDDLVPNSNAVETRMREIQEELDFLIEIKEREDMLSWF